MGRSLSTEPSIQRWGDAFQGCARPVFGSFARISEEEKMKGTEQDAAMALQIKTFGAVK